MTFFRAVCHPRRAQLAMNAGQDTFGLPIDIGKRAKDVNFLLANQPAAKEPPLYEQDEGYSLF